MQDPCFLGTPKLRIILNPPFVSFADYVYYANKTKLYLSERKSNYQMKQNIYLSNTHFCTSKYYIMINLI